MSARRTIEENPWILNCARLGVDNRGIEEEDAKGRVISYTLTVSVFGL